MIKEGQLIIGTSSRYGITNERSLCLVKEILGRGNIEVTVVAHTRGERFTGVVEDKYFKPCTYEEFMKIYPHAVLTSTYTEEELRVIKNDGAKIEIPELRMDKEKIGKYELSEEERTNLKKEITNLLREYEYNPTDNGVNKIINTWISNKGWLINVFKNHPNYNGKYQISFDSDFMRNCDTDTIYSFGRWLENKAIILRKEAKLGPFTLREITDIYSRIDRICDSLYTLKRNGHYVLVDGKTYEEWKVEKQRWVDKYNKFQTLIRQSDKFKSVNYECYTTESYNNYFNMANFAENIKYNKEHIATEDFINKVNKYFPEAKAVVGQKVSRIVNKICTLTGLNKDPDYNREFAKYSDALNPLAIKRHTIISCHPIDYLTMSFGNSWASCHTIDKHNKRNMPDSYSGCYSSGTLSYMLDASSFVFYTVDKDYNGDKYELQDKINRNMFHMGEDKLIQARVYPQTTDGEGGIYKQIREICQKVIADCLGVPNFWDNIKGANECSYMISSEGTHYKDYTNFEDCNVSYLKNESGTKNKNFIVVGHDPICPCCGHLHDHQEAVECYDCYEHEEKCVECSSTYDLHEIDGDYYCEDCCFYCEYHEQWEVGDPDDSYYIEDYGRVCEEAYESGDFFTCEECGDDFYTGERGINTEDGIWFCCHDCAIDGGYCQLEDGRWYRSDDVYYCEYCGRNVHVSEWNHELECCDQCKEEVLSREEREAV